MFTAFLGYLLYLTATDNFHEVVPRQVYRSGQMSPHSLARTIPRYGIRTVLNLRGADGASSWYSAETNVCRQLGVRHLDYALSANRDATDQELDAIMALIQSSPKPILIHCRAGADRAGLISALCRYVQVSDSASEAGTQLSFRYAHFPHLFWRGTQAMDRSYARYVSHHGNGIAHAVKSIHSAG